MGDPWQQRRSSLNHDWLMNDFMKSVNAFVARLGQQRPNHERIREFLSTDLPIWEVRREELRLLLADAEEALSPRRLFDVPPLMRCEPDTAAWLAPLVHALWLTRYPVKQWIKDARQAVDSADTMYAKVKCEFCEGSETVEMSRLQGANGTFREFADALRTLTCAISVFPKRQSVV